MKVHQHVSDRPRLDTRIPSLYFYVLLVSCGLCAVTAYFIWKCLISHVHHCFTSHLRYFFLLHLLFCWPISFCMCSHSQIDALPVNQALPAALNHCVWPLVPDFLPVPCLFCLPRRWDFVSDILPVPDLAFCLLPAHFGCHADLFLGYDILALK